jgi:hypothetical protein
VHVIEGGSWVESGTFAELMERPAGRFRRLWASQSGEHAEPERDMADVTEGALP